MAKQIYIDSNGNEIPVSGTITNDNNLPHYSGTPTAGSTAYEIASKANKTATVTMTMEGTFRKERFSGGVNDKIVSFSASIGGIVDISLNTLTKVATISKAPTDDCIVPTINVETGATVGYIRIYTNGDIKLYKSASGNYCGFSVNYATS